MNSKMVPVGNFVQLLCLALVLALSCTDASPSFRGRQPVNQAKVPKVEREKFGHWGPQTFLGWLPVRSRRTEIENSISPFAAPPSSSPLAFPPRVSPEASALGESIMQEFILFLTMKDSGLLDLCMQFKR
ncbi:uncharacterized protein LOC143301278 isoform X1 [Babylonia areolata]|uniref:uncharacterized protein LOC143301278 isoform X1 n=1 Tax=Babylonia areolata TaxID=304850 RepID=UPI003FD12029